MVALASGTGRGWQPRLDLARQVLTDPHRFDFPGDVSRSGDLSGSRGDTRSGHTLFQPLAPRAGGARAARPSPREWDAALAEHERDTPG